MTETAEINEQQHIIPIVHAFPGMSPEILITLAQDAKALILVGYANGAAQRELLPAIRQIVGSGTTVVGLSDNPGAGHGVVRYTDQTQHDAVEAGVTYLEKPNITNMPEVVEALRKNLDTGLVGQELSSQLKSQFAYGPNEERPVSELDGGVFFPQKSK